MNIPHDLQLQVRSTVDTSIGHVLKAYPNMVLPPITITYEKCFSKAGWASYEDYQVNFNPILLLANQSEFIKQIIPHEVAHVIAAHLFGHDIDDHGPEWKSIMVLMGIEPLAFHTLDTSISKRKMTTYQFTCGCTGYTHELGTMLAKKARLHVVHCLTCDQQVVSVDPVYAPSRMPKKVALGTKKDRATWLIKHCKGKPKKEVIRRLVVDAKLTIAGANTYYYLLRDC